MFLIGVLQFFSGLDPDQHGRRGAGFHRPLALCDEARAADDSPLWVLLPPARLHLRQAGTLPASQNAPESAISQKS